MYKVVFIFQFILPDIDECASRPCQHGGTCVDNVNKYTCYCAVGYTGYVCRTGKVLLIVIVEIYTCTCFSGYEINTHGMGETCRFALFYSFSGLSFALHT